MKPKHVCAGCGQPLTAMKVTLGTPSGWQTYCGACGRREVEKKQREEKHAKE